jgi:hypothetical protein
MATFAPGNCFFSAQEVGRDALPEINTAAPVSRTGDLWLLGRNCIVWGNSLSPGTYSALMAGAWAAMVFTDPPCSVPISGYAAGLGAIQDRNFNT